MSKNLTYKDFHKNLSVESQIALQNIMKSKKSFYTFLGEINYGEESQSVSDFVSNAQVLSRKEDQGVLRVASGFQYELKNAGRKVNTSVVPLTNHGEYTSYAVVADNTNLFNLPNKLFTAYIDDRTSPFVNSGTHCPRYQELSKIIATKLGKSYLKEAIETKNNNDYEIICHALFLASKDAKQNKTESTLFANKLAEKTASSILTTLLVLKAVDLGVVEAEKVCESALQVQYCNILNYLGTFGKTISNSIANAVAIIEKLGLTVKDILSKNERMGYESNLENATITKALFAGINLDKYFSENLGVDIEHEVSKSDVNIKESVKIVKDPLQEFFAKYGFFAKSKDDNDKNETSIRKFDKNSEDNIEEDEDGESHDFPNAVQQQIYRKTLSNRITKIIQKELSPTVSILLDENKVKFFKSAKSVIESWNRLNHGDGFAIGNDDFYIKAGFEFGCDLIDFREKIVSGVFGDKDNLLIPDPEYSASREQKNQRSAIVKKLYLISEKGIAGIRECVRKAINNKTQELFFTNESKAKGIAPSSIGMLK